MKKVLIVGLLAFVAAVSCKDKMPVEVFENPDAEFNIMITGYTSEFKQIIIDEIIEKYSPWCNIEIVDFAVAHKIDPDEYAAIIVMDEVEAWMIFNRKTRRFMKKIEPKEKLILYITAGDEKWQYSKDGIEAITSASVTDERTRVLEEIFTRLDALLR